MVGCMPSLLVMHDIAIGDVSKDAQFRLLQGFSDEHIRQLE